MPNRKRVRRFVPVVVAALLALAISAPGASAKSSSTVGAACEIGAVDQVFSEFGDLNWYYLASGGDFEGSLSWASTGKALLVSVRDLLDLIDGLVNPRIGLGGLTGGLGDLVEALEDLPDDLEDLPDGVEDLPAAFGNSIDALGASSLVLFKGARVTTPKLCVTSDTPHLRFLALAAGKSKRLDVEVRLYNSRGRVTDSSKGSISSDDHRFLRPTRFVSLHTDELAPGETAYVDMIIRSKGEWLIDNVFIDPYRKG